VADAVALQTLFGSPGDVRSDGASKKFPIAFKPGFVFWEDHPQRDYCSSTPVWWLHFPKCGTSFEHTVQKCKLDPLRGPEMHKPLPLGSPSLHNVVAMFRTPAQRLASMYAFVSSNPDVCGPSHCQWTWGANRSTEDKVFELVSKGRTAANDDFLGSSFLGCQTNMVLGRKCMHGTPEDPAQDAQTAISLVDKFRFIGLVEEWGLSICLFNFKTAGKRFVTYGQLVNDRPTASKHGCEYDVSGYPRDVADEKLYAHVAQRVREEFKKHGISKEACSFDEHGEIYEM